MLNFYKNKRVLVIGGAGFIGSHLVKQLLERGAYVYVLDDLSRGTIDNFVDLGIEAKFHIADPEMHTTGFFYGDCSDEGTCRDALKNIDYIFNLAAHVAGVDYNQSHHFEMFSKNLAAQLMPLRVANEYGIEKYLNVSSVCVYAPGHNSPAVEENGLIGTPTAANIGYSLAKRMGEYAAIWSQIPVVRVRPSNVFGPLDYFDERAHVIPALIKKCIEDDRIVVNGTGKEIREFIYVDDVAAGMIAAMEHGQAGEVYNLGTNGQTAVSIADLVLTLRELTGMVHKLIVFQQQFDSGDNERWSNCFKAKRDLEWKSETVLNKGLRKTIEWYIQSE
jgi:nucleoside-diphosphate-sugar epimerase